MSELYMESLASERFSIETLTTTTTKSLYESMTETMPPSAVELKYPERNYDLIWKQLNYPVLEKSTKSVLYLLLHEKYVTRERGFRRSGANVPE